MHAKLVVVGGNAGAPQFELQLPAIIGRSRQTDVTLEHPLISRHHCEVFESSGQLMLRDLGSRNGTYLGQTRLAESPLPVQPGDQFTIGPVTFRAEYPPEGRGPGDSGPHDPVSRDTDSRDTAPRDSGPHAIAPRGIVGPRDGIPGNPQRPPRETDSTLRRVVWKRL